MKIVWVSHSADLAGAELSLCEAVQGLGGRGVEVEVVLPAVGPLHERLQEMGVPVTVLPYSFWIYRRGTPLRKRLHGLRGSMIDNLWLGQRALTGLLRQRRPDLVVTNTTTIPVGALAARRTGTPHVWYVHEFGREDQGLQFYLGERLSILLIRALSRRVIVNSQAVARKFGRYIGPEKLRLVYYAVETRCPPRGEQGAADTFRLSLVGTLAPGKGQEDAVRSLADLARQGVNARLALVGPDGSAYATWLKSLAQELGVAERVDFAGYQRDPFPAMAAADVVLMCSRSEAFGRVSVEAMKLGKPVVGADSAGTAELIRDGWNGFLYRVGDAEDLARKIATLSSDRALLAEMGRNAAEWSRQTFSLDRYTTRLLEVFEEAVRS